MSGFLQYLHTADPTVTPVDGDVPVYSTAGDGYVPTAGVNGNVTAAATLTSNQVVIGQGTKAVATLGSLGTTTTVLHGNAGGAPSFGTVVEADITLADNTTNNCSTSAHGFLKKLDNNANNFMNGQGNWATPSGAGNVSTSGTLASGQTVIGAGTTNIDVSSLTATVVKSSSGTLSAATAGTDYVAPGVTSVQSPTDQRTSNGDFATTYTIAANTATAGMIFDLYLVGSEHVTAGSLFQYSVKFGSTTILPAQGFSAAATNGTWTAKGQFIVLVDGASGKVGGTWGVGQTNGVTGADTTLSRNPWIRPITAEVSVDWTTNQVITVAVTGLAASATSNLTRMVVRSY